MKIYRSGRVLVFLFTMAFMSAGFSAGAASTNYAGLVYSGSADASSGAGIFKMSVSPNRKFSGSMTIESRSAHFSGRFDTNGVADIVVKITVDNSCYGCDPPIIDIETKKLWDVHFQISPGGDSISGGLHFRKGGLPDGTLSGKRSSFSRANEVPAAGKYTFAFAGSGDPANTNFPTGNGLGTININSSGNVSISGSLADKSAFSQGTLLCDDGTIPMYDSLYNGKGIIQGWLGLTNSVNADVAGDLLWEKPSYAGRTFYPAGFTNDVPVVGSRYVKTNPVLDWTNGVMVFQGGNLSSPFTNSILVDARGRVSNLSGNKLELKIQSATGRFSGSAKNPITNDGISFSGVILQKENVGFGFFPDAPLSGQVTIGPAGP